MDDEEDEEQEETEAGGTPIEEKHTLRIIRLPGKGLGISIAGGHGSTPYKGDDEVGVVDNNNKIPLLSISKL